MGPFYFRDTIVNQTINNWIQEHRILFIEVYFPGVSVWYEFFFNSIELYSDIILYADNHENNTRDRWEFNIFKNAYPIRGILSNKLLTEFRQKYTEGEQWNIMQNSLFPDKIEYIANGNSWDEIQIDLKNNYEEFNNSSQTRDYSFVHIGRDHEFLCNDPNCLTIINNKENEEFFKNVKC